MERNTSASFATDNLNRHSVSGFVDSAMRVLVSWSFKTQSQRICNTMTAACMAAGPGLCEVLLIRDLSAELGGCPPTQSIRLYATNRVAITRTEKLGGLSFARFAGSLLPQVRESVSCGDFVCRHESPFGHLPELIGESADQPTKLNRPLPESKVLPCQVPCAVSRDR